MLRIRNGNRKNQNAVKRQNAINLETLHRRMENKVATYEHPAKDAISWDRGNIQQMCRSFKNNIIASATTRHFGSSGETFSFGVGTKFCCKEGVSFRNYA
eukprot:12996213-Ditylum_brightwellii.AAC.1